jgi:hypothetical protein
VASGLIPDAIEAAHGAVQVAPKNWYAHLVLVGCLEVAGQTERLVLTINLTSYLSMTRDIE